MEYHSGQGYAHSNENSIIQNLKKPMSRKGAPEWRHKEEAIRNIGLLCNSAFSRLDDKTLIIPIPPSKTKNDVGHDNRLIQILEIATQDNINTTYDENIIVQKENYDASHNNHTNRISKEELKSIYQINLDGVDANIKKIIIFDDVITTGTHFRVASDKLLQTFNENQYYSNIEIVGFFVARTIHPESEEDIILKNIHP